MVSLAHSSIHSPAPRLSTLAIYIWRCLRQWDPPPPANPPPQYLTSATSECPVGRKWQGILRNIRYGLTRGVPGGHHVVLAKRVCRVPV